ncbi:hypothetical protein [Vandammella animalimorsus]|uniref:Uncharacterized protein n=1 Tax=Vandammella animalimorsus TaxID=2029117 RepID=A0A2A2ABW0_9BURK|nr:hypothetical protein [Vandammella animalimorsus]PAT35241.1 hypothetical protein CK620_04950 [Vandammella animalimorsus]
MSLERLTDALLQRLHDAGAQLALAAVRAVGAVSGAASGAGQAVFRPTMAALMALGTVLAVAGCEWPGPSSGSFGPGTPPSTRDRGELLRTVQHGPFSVEIRRYIAGRASQGTAFCDYWISHRGQPVQLDTLYERQNSYNNCQALQLLPGPGLLIMGEERPGEKIPYVVTETAQGAVQVQARDRPWADCKLSWAEISHGWQVVGGQVKVCGQFMAVLPMPTS